MPVITFDVPRFMVQAEIFKRIIPVTGSIVECGVGNGNTFMGWAQCHYFLDPLNLARRLIGFDTFKGFPNVSPTDKSQYHDPKIGDVAFDIDVDGLADAVGKYMYVHYVREPKRVELVAGDVVETIPKYIKQNQHTVVSLLHLDMDLYEPTMCALEHFVPLMPKGGLVVFDEVNMTRWPGETRAIFDYFGGNPRLESYAPHSAAAVLEI